MPKKVKTIREAIEALKEYPDLDQPIAINWWLKEDFEDYFKGVIKAIGLAQDYLDHLNPDLIDYVENEY